MSRFAFVTSSFLAWSVVACGGGNNSSNLGGDAADTGANGDGGVGVDGAMNAETGTDSGSGCVPGSDYDATPQAGFPATHPAHPQVAKGPGSVLATPSVYLVFTQNTALEPQITTFAQTLGAQPYWSAATSEYGVGTLNYAGSKDLNDTTLAVTMTDTQVDAYVTSKLSSGAFGSPDPNTIYTFFFPASTTITSQSALGSGTTCKDIGGYHTSASVSGKNIPYAVVPLCANFGGLVGIDSTTGAASHELAEASTDPFPQVSATSFAYAQVDNAHAVWFFLGGEVGDLCAQRDDVFYKPSCFDFTVQRIWSNKAAATGGDPCVPKAVGPYFNAAPVEPDSVTLDLTKLTGELVPTMGNKIAQGASKTIEVDLFSDFPVSGPIEVEAVDAIAKLAGTAPTMTFAWDKTSGQNGDKLHLTITVTGASPLGVSHPYIIVTQVGTNQNLWPALVSEN